MKKFTKSDIVLALAEGLQQQEDTLLLTRAYENYGIDLTHYNEDTLEQIAKGDMEVISELINQRNMAMAGQAADTIHKVATQAGQHIASGASHIANAASAHPAAAAGVGLGLAALAAIRARRNAKARAAAKAAGV